MAIFRDVINEYYVAESSKKIKAVKRANSLQGKSMGVIPFGYKCGDDKALWEVDEPAAEIVREVFQRYISGMNISAIARAFQSEGILTASQYRQSVKGVPISEKKWSLRSVENILDGKMYTGTYVGCRYSNPSYKNRKSIELPEEEWIKIENHHPPIVTVEVYETVKRLRGKKIRKTRHNYTGALSGLAYCKDCGARMAMARYMTSKTKVRFYFLCSRFRGRSISTRDDYICSRHSVRMDYLDAAVLAKIQETVSMAVKDKSVFIERVNSNTNKDTEKAIKLKSAELAKGERRVAELDNIISRIYEDYVARRLTAERFDKMLGGYESEQSALTVKVTALQTEVEALKTKTANVQSFISLAEQYGEITELTPEIARTFIKEILVHEREGDKLKIEIFLAYIGKFE